MDGEKLWIRDRFLVRIAARWTSFNVGKKSGENLRIYLSYRYLFLFSRRLRHAYFNHDTGGYPGETVDKAAAWEGEAVQ
ncbi:hypothetical protein [Caulobacter radicis]|uniref:hypothetical protein n=1 Tax=Caulobacter radicis TaxID=2172650 RepID=UPI0014037CBF|nr:hypothetical protein [Caulobacter radicis]